MVYPQTYHLVLYQAHTWLANRGLLNAGRAHWVLNALSRGYFDFPAGSCSGALKPSRGSLTLNHVGRFPESGQTDGTLAHTLERMLGVSVVDQGYHLAIL